MTEMKINITKRPEVYYSQISYINKMNNDGRIEIIDRNQRLSTLLDFLNKSLIKKNYHGQ